MTLPFLMSAPGETPVILEADINADVARVYKAWTDPEDFKKWFGREPGQVKEATLDVRAGGIWNIDFGQGENGHMWLHGAYLDVEPGEKLVFSWRHRQQLPDGQVQESPESKVTVIFEMIPSGTRLHLIHEAIQAQDVRSNVGLGWSSSFAMLKGLVEQLAA